MDDFKEIKSESLGKDGDGNNLLKIAMDDEDESLLKSEEAWKLTFEGDVPKVIINSKITKFKRKI